MLKISQGSKWCLKNITKITKLTDFWKNKYDRDRLNSSYSMLKFLLLARMSERHHFLEMLQFLQAEFDDDHFVLSWIVSSQWETVRNRWSFCFFVRRKIKLIMCHISQIILNYTPRRSAVSVQKVFECCWCKTFTKSKNKSQILSQSTHCVKSVKSSYLKNL